MEMAALKSPSLIEQLTITLIGVFAFLQVYSIQAILPILIHDLNASEVQAGMMVGATVMGIALLSPFVGILSDRLGRKIFVVGALFLLSIPTALISISQSVHIISFWRFLQGIFVPGITVVLIAYIGEEYRHHLAKMMSLYVMGTVLGGFGGRFLVGHLNELIGWRYAYAVMAIFTLIGAIIVLKTLPKSQHFSQSGNWSSAVTLLISHAKNRYVISACLLGACVLFSLVACFTFINLHLAQPPYLLSTSALANIFSIYLIGMVITPLSTKAIGRFGMVKTIIGAVSISASGVLLTLSAPLWIIIFGLTLMSSGVFVTQSATISYIASHITKGRSLASGLYYMSYYGGGSIGAWLCGLVYMQGQWTYTVYTIIGVQLLALTVALIFMRQ